MSHIGELFNIYPVHIYSIHSIQFVRITVSRIDLFANAI